MTNTAGFRSGHQKLGGRKRGTSNKSTPFDQRAVLKAAHLVGFDLNGKDGLVGYFKWVALSHPRAFLMMAPGIMDIQERARSSVAQPPWTMNDSSRTSKSILALTVSMTTKTRLAPTCPGVGLDGVFRLAH